MSSWNYKPPCSTLTDLYKNDHQVKWRATFVSYYHLPNRSKWMKSERTQGKAKSFRISMCRVPQVSPRTIFQNSGKVNEISDRETIAQNPGSLKSEDSQSTFARLRLRLFFQKHVSPILSENTSSTPMSITAAMMALATHR